MPGIARVGDIGVGVCPRHTTPVSYTALFVEGAPTVRADGSPVVRVGSVAICSCGHPAVALTGSETVRAGGGAGVHRVGDLGNNYGAYTVISGSAKNRAGG